MKIFVAWLLLCMVAACSDDPKPNETKQIGVIPKERPPVAVPAAKLPSKLNFSIGEKSHDVSELSSATCVLFFDKSHSPVLVAKLLSSGEQFELRATEFDLDYGEYAGALPRFSLKLSSASGQWSNEGNCKLTYSLEDGLLTAQFACPPLLHGEFSCPLADDRPLGPKPEPLNF